MKLKMEKEQLDASVRRCVFTRAPICCLYVRSAMCHQKQILQWICFMNASARVCVFVCVSVSCTKHICYEIIISIYVHV